MKQFPVYDALYDYSRASRVEITPELQRVEASLSSIEQHLSYFG